MDVPFRRLTKDIDFRGYTNNSQSNIEEIFRNVCLQECPEDGLHFDPDTLVAEITQVNAEYDGIRANLTGYLGRSQIPIQIDIGFSDAITPNPNVITYPSILSDLPSPTLQGYPPETIVAEKFHAIVRLGEVNSRLRDFYDIWLLSEHFEFEGSVLQEALHTTFDHRRTDFPSDLPSGLTTDFAVRNQMEWIRTVLDKNRRAAEKGHDFSFVIERIRTFLVPPIQALTGNQPFNLHWQAGYDWH